MKKERKRNMLAANEPKTVIYVSGPDSQYKCAAQNSGSRISFTEQVLKNENSYPYSLKLLRFF